MAFFLSHIVIKPQQSFLISIWGYLSKQYQIWNIPKVIIICNAIPPRKSNPWNESQRVSLSWFNTKQIRHLEYSPFTCENNYLALFFDWLCRDAPLLGSGLPALSKPHSCQAYSFRKWIFQKCIYHQLWI